jgi:hypothetical protein
VEDEDSEAFCEKYASLLVTLCCHYEVLLIQESDVSTALFQLIIDCAAAKSLKISSISLEFWDIFKETLQNVSLCLVTMLEFG